MKEDRPLPRYSESENVLLSCIAQRPDILDEENFTEEMFTFPLNLIFRKLAELATEHQSLDFYTLVSSFTPKELEEVGGREMLNEVLDSTLVPDEWRHAYGFVLEGYQRRKQIEFFLRHLDRCFDLETEWQPEAWLKFDPGIRSRPPKLKTRELFRACLDRICRKPSESGRMHLSGIKRLDQTLGYVRTGNVVVIGAQTSLGKSAMAHNIAAAACMNGASKKVAIFSMEMTRDEVCERIFAGECDIQLADIREQNIDLEKLRKMERFIGEKIPDGYPLMVIDESIQDVGAIVSMCKRFKKEHGLDLVIVDYLQLISPLTTGKETNRQIEVASVSRKLKVMAKDLDVIVVSLSQLNDQNQLRESRAIGQDADIVLYIVEPKDATKTSLREIHIMKSRNGRSKDKVEVDFFPPYASFANRE